MINLLVLFKLYNNKNALVKGIIIEIKKMILFQEQMENNIKLHYSYKWGL